MRVSSFQLRRKLRAGLLAAGVLWVVAVTAGSDTAVSAFSALRASLPLEVLRWELGDLWTEDSLSPAVVMTIGESPLLLAARPAVAELWQETETPEAPPEAEQELVTTPVAHALRFDVDCWPQARGNPFVFTYDLSTAPFGHVYSTIFVPIQFALWTNPRRLFLVGCDCSHGGHFYTTAQNNELCIDKIYEGYLNLKKFAARYYPQTEIISVNPVGLKGLFKDWNQKDGEPMPK